MIEVKMLAKPSNAERKGVFLCGFDILFCESYTCFLFVCFEKLLFEEYFILSFLYNIVFEHQ